MNVTRHSTLFFTILGFFVLYAITAPFSVQSGDTGELVTNAYHLRVSHPPGYPLYTLLYHLPVRYIPFSTPFHVAALLTALITCGWLGMLFFKFKRLEALLLICLIGTNLSFWRYAVLPDVFTLHMFFLTLIFLIFIEPSLLSRPWIIFLAALSVTNHHTIVFVFPMFLYALSNSLDIKKSVAYSLLFGAMALASYSVLILFHPDEYGSWSHIDSLESVVHHFLRRDYGTFQLSSHSGAVDGKWLSLFSRSLLGNAWSLLLVFSYLIIKEKKQIFKIWRPLLVMMFCVAAYLFTFYVGGNVPLDTLGETVFERFLLQPTLLIFFLALYIIYKLQIQFPKWLLLVVLINVGLNIVTNFDINNYRKNTHLEDYTLNAFNILPENSIFYSYGDNIGYASYYVQSVLGVREDVVLLHATSGFKWSMHKAAKKYPNAIKVQSTILESLNFDDFNFYINISQYVVPKFRKLTLHGLLYELSKSEESHTPAAFNCDFQYKRRNRLEIEDLSVYEGGKLYDLMYGNCHFLKALSLQEEGKLEEAKQELLVAVELSPLSALIQERLCELYEKLDNPAKTECEERLEYLLMASNPQYFLNKYEL